MADVNPFKAARPAPENAEKVACPPYDVMSVEEARQMASDNPLSFLRVIRSEIDLPRDIDPYSDQVYKKAVENYKEIKTQAPFTEDDTPYYYIYELEMNGRKQTGIAAVAAVDDYDNDVIKKHEKTRKEKEDDRTRHITELRAQSGLVFLTYRDSPDVDSIVAEAVKQDPLYDFRAADGIRHTVWQVPAEMTASLKEAFEAIPEMYIADGHHRAASASRTRALYKEQNPNHTGDEAYNQFLGVIFPASHLQILPYNRIVKDLNGYSSAELLEKLQEKFTVEKTSETEPEKRHVFHMYLDGSWYRLTYPHSTENLSPVKQLDVSLLQEVVLEPLFGIGNPKSDKRIDFVGGIRGTGELERCVNENEAAVAFSMYPTTVEDLIAISDAGEIMPPKSTWFEPKLRDGLLVHEI